MGDVVVPLKYFLYKKTHRVTGLKYLGKTTRDPYLYQGSGTRWTKHIAKHGYDVDTEILLETASKEDIKLWGEYYSNLWHVVESKEWANLKPETGDGGDTSMCENYVKGIANRDLSGEKNPMWGGFTDEHRANLSKAKKGIKPSNFDQWSKSSKGKYYLNNGIIEKRFAEDEIPQGWNWGRLKIQCVCGKMVDKTNQGKYHKECLRITEDSNVKD